MREMREVRIQKTENLPWQDAVKLDFGYLSQSVTVARCFDLCAQQGLHFHLDLQHCRYSLHSELAKICFVPVALGYQSRLGTEYSPTLSVVRESWNLPRQQRAVGSRSRCYQRLNFLAVSIFHVQLQNCLLHSLRFGDLAVGLQPY